MYLGRVCGDDRELRQEVESLLGYERRSAHELESVIQAAAADVADTGSANVVGQRIGTYELIRPIGRGGMGSVYLAVRADDTFRKQVALKVVKRGMDTDFVLSRFRHERQILAALEHPNIARLLDGGATPEGLPFFVMEYVEGEPVTSYCTHKQLTIDQRIHLFRQVCSAVTAAHQNLVVHRDIKPGNILVTKDGVPKLLDFGIAKMLQSDISTTAMTQTVTGVRMMTPDYASPEQVRGEAITTATDVYSLGVLLYELLTGRAPYQFPSSSIVDIQRVICEREPQPPSLMAPEARRQLRGDLDNIVLMAVRKEPARRYQSVQQLSEDLLRYLDGLPIVARKDTVLYRASKFVQRNQVGVAAAILLLITITAGVVSTVYQARKAARRFEQVRGLATAFIFDFHDSISNVPGTTKARELVVKKGLEYLDGLAGEAGGDSTLQLELGTAYVKVGDVQGDPMGGNLGDSTGALSSYERAVKILSDIKPRNDAVRRSLSNAYYHLALLQRQTGASATALGSLHRAHEVAEELLASNPSHEDLKNLASIYDSLSRTLGQLGDLEGSLTAINRAVTILQRLVAAAPDKLDFQDQLASAHGTLAIQLPRVGKLHQALEHAKKALQMRERLSAGRANDLARTRMLMIAWSHIGDNLANPTRPNMGDLKGALEAYAKVHRIAASLAARDPNDKRLQLDLSYALQRIGVAEFGDRRLDDAIQHLTEARKIQESVIHADPKNATAIRNLAFVLERIGLVEDARGNHVRALSALRQSVETNEELLKRDPANQDARQQLLSVSRTYALMQAKDGNTQAALKVVSELPALADELVRKGSSDWTRIVQPALTTAVIAEIEEALGHKQEAERHYQESVKAFASLKKQGKLDPFYAPAAERVAARIH